MQSNTEKRDQQQKSNIRLENPLALSVWALYLGESFRQSSDVN